VRSLLRNVALLLRDVLPQITVRLLHVCSLFIVNVTTRCSYVTLHVYVAAHVYVAYVAFVIVGRLPAAVPHVDVRYEKFTLSFAFATVAYAFHRSRYAIVFPFIYTITRCDCCRCYRIRSFDAMLLLRSVVAMFLLLLLSLRVTLIHFTLPYIADAWYVVGSLYRCHVTTFVNILPHTRTVVTGPLRYR